MPKKIAMSTLNASTIDILNTIRANANYEYQSSIPTITSESEIPKVGEILLGYPALANTFINALVNRIALVRVKSVTFNNAYKMLKKGYLEFGETVEDVFIGLAKAVAYNPDKAQAREFKRTLPDVKTAFYAMNWKVQYPVTIQEEDLKQAFLSIQGVQDLIAKIVDSVYTGAEYDEFLLFKYLLIKSISKGKVFPVAFDSDNMSESAEKFRGYSNKLIFPSNTFNELGVKNSTPKAKQHIFMDALFNAKYDVNVLASAFNMDKADFMGKLQLIDDFTSFDNERFAQIRAESDMIEEVTSEELALMQNVKAVLVDEDWFQIYDNINKFTEVHSGSGMYWNYFYNVWKTVANSPFANAVVFVDDSATITPPSTVTLNVDSVVKNDETTIITFGVADTNTLASTDLIFEQTQEATQDGVAVHKYGAIILPQSTDTIVIKANIKGVEYTSPIDTPIGADVEVGSTVTMTKVV